MALRVRSILAICQCQNGLVRPRSTILLATRPIGSTQGTVPWRASPINLAARRTFAQKVRDATAKFPASSKKHNSPSPKPSNTPYNPQSHSLVDTLQARGRPTLLHDAPSHAPFFTAAYTIGAFCFAYAGFNLFSNVMFPLYAIDAFPRYALAGACVLMTAAGGFFVTRPRRLIRTLTAMPSQQGLQLRFEIESMVPFRRPRTFTVPLQSVTLSDPLYHSKIRVPELENAVSSGSFLSGKSNDTGSRRGGSMKQGASFVSLAFYHIQALFGRVGFVKIFVEGRKGAWKLDANSGWSLDEGRSIDRLIKQKVY